MYGTDIGGHMEIIDFIIEKRANDWNKSMEGSSLRGHMEIVKFVIQKGPGIWK